MDMSIEPINALEALLRKHANAHGKANPKQSFDEVMRELMRDPDVARAAKVFSDHHIKIEQLRRRQPSRMGKGARRVLLHSYKTGENYIIRDLSDKGAVESLIKRGLMVKTDQPNTYAITNLGKERAAQTLVQYRKQRLNGRKEAS
jgi:hypothetical protein